MGTDNPLGYIKAEMLNFLRLQQYTDCLFQCMDGTVSAHRIILAARSPVFKLVFGNLAVSRIYLLETISEDCMMALKFIYANEIDIHSVRNAWGLVYIARRFLLSDLLKICLDYIHTHIAASNVVLSFERAQLYHVIGVKLTCWRQIRMYAKFLLMTDYHMKLTTLKKVLRQRKINIENRDLIILTVKWAKEECLLRGIDLTIEAIKNILTENGLFECIYFRKIDANLYCDLQFPSYQAIIESINIANNLTSESKCRSITRILPDCTPNLFRESMQHKRIHTFHKSAVFEAVLEVMRPVYIFGIVITALNKEQSSSGYLNRINLTVENNGLVCYKENFKRYATYNSLQNISFSLPLLCETDRIYNFKIEYELNTRIAESSRIELQVLRDEVYLDDAELCRFNDFWSVIHAVCCLYA